MNQDTKTRLTQVFTDHTALMKTAALTRATQDHAKKKLKEAFRSQFEIRADTLILPVFEELSATVRKNGHGCTVTRATHGTFFSGPDDAPGVIFMFYPESIPEEDYALKPTSSYVALFADLFRQKAQLYAKSVRPGNFTPGQLPDLLSLSAVTKELLETTCIGIIKETLHRMEV